MSSYYSSNVDVTSIPEVEVSNDTGNPVPVSSVGGTLNNGVAVAVTQVASQILAANANRKKLIIQSQGAGVISVGTTGVTTTTGTLITANSILIIDGPNCPINAIFAVRTTNGSTNVMVQEVV